MLFLPFLAFLTVGTKSKCGTLQRLTHPRQSTVSPIPKPASSPKRQASQRKPFVLSSVSAQTSSHLRIHGILVPPGAPTCDPSCAPLTPSLPKVASNSQTGVTQHHEMIRTSNILRGNCMRNCRAAPVYARPEAAAEVTIRARGHPSPPGDQRAQVATHPDR